MRQTPSTDQTPEWPLLRETPPPPGYEPPLEASPLLDDLEARRPPGGADGAQAVGGAEA